MTTAADDAADEIAFEAFLAGRPVPTQADGSSPAVAAFVGAVRATATLPGRPNAALAELLATGLLADQSSPSTRTAPSTGTSPRRSRVRRRRFAMFLPALVAKFLSLGAVAQAASGVGIAVVAFTGAGATGMLGTNVQTTLTSVVGATGQTTGEVTPAASPSASPTGTPTQTPTGSPAVQTPTATTPASATPTFDAKAWALNGPAAGQSFGEWVREAARAGKVDGSVVSAWAHKKHIDLSKVEGIGDVERGDDSESSTPTRTPEVETEHAAGASHAESGDDHHDGGHKNQDGGDRGHGGD